MKAWDVGNSWRRGQMLLQNTKWRILRRNYGTEKSNLSQTESKGMATYTGKLTKRYT